MESTTDRIVFVSAKSLDDVLELSRLAAERLPQGDPLVSALRGAIANARLDAITEP